MPVFARPCISLNIVIIAVFILTVSFQNDHLPLKHGTPFSPKLAKSEVLFPLPFPLGKQMLVESAAVITLNSSLVDENSWLPALVSILKIAGRVYVACACNFLPLKQWRLGKFVYCSMLTVIDPKNSLSQSGVFCEMVETGINIFNMDFYKWEFLISTHFLVCFYSKE